MKLASLILMLATGTALAATEEQINKTFPLAPGGTVVVDVDDGAIDVTTNATAEVAVNVWRQVTRKNKAEETAFLRDNPVELLTEGNTVTVRYRQKREKHSWFSWHWGNDRHEAKFTLKVPAHCDAKLGTSGGGIAVSDVTGSVKADTSGGGLRFVRLQGPLHGETSGGNIQAEDCAGEIKIETSGGNVTVTGGSGGLNGGTSGGDVSVKNFHGSASVETSGGSITIENVAGALKAETSGGDVHAVLPNPIPGAVKLETSGGSITVKVAAEAAFNLDAETSGGGVQCELPILLQGEKTSDELKGTVNGGGPTLKLETSGGGIRVQKL